MPGHLRQRGKSGTWYVEFHFRDPVTGKHKYVQRSTECTDKREAKVAAARILTELKASMSAISLGNANAQMTLGEWFDAWLHDYCEPQLSPNTVKQYGSLIRNHINPSIGSVQLSKLRTPRLQHFILQVSMAPRRDGKPGHLAPGSVFLIRAVLDSALNRAVKLRVIPSSPMENVELPRSREESHEIVPMTPDEALAFLTTAQQISPYYALYWVVLSTGLRIGEALGLRWRDLNLDTGVLAVRHNLLRGKGEVNKRLSKLKTRKSTRDLPLSPAPLEALKQHRKAQIQARLRAGPFWQDHDLIFCTGKGTPLNDGNIRERDIKRILAKAGLGHYRLHDLRHTSATMALLAGVPAKVVQQRLGHSRISTTMDVYSHVTQDLQRSASDLIERVMLGGDGATSKPSDG